MSMTDREVNELVDSLSSRNTRFLVEFRKIEAERDSHYVTTNFEQAKSKAEGMVKDTRYKDVKLHRITIEKTWLPVASVEFMSEGDEDERRDGQGS